MQLQHALFRQKQHLEKSHIFNICFLALLSADAACMACARSWKSGVNLSNIVPKWCTDQQLLESTFLSQPELTFLSQPELTFLSQPELTFLSQTKFAIKVVQV